MAEFNAPFEQMLVNEGGYKLHTVEGDTGGMTYAGIARNPNPQWEGWSYIDASDLDNPDLKNSVRAFYKKNYWDRLRGDEIDSQKIAATLFDFGVNAGTGRAAKLAQQTLGATADGVLGAQTLALLNGQDEALFLARYALAKISFYAEICNRKGTQKKFLLGWVNRALKETA